MKRALIFLGIVLISISLAYAWDDERVAKKLVDMVKGKHHHPEYYTGKHHFMNEEGLMSDNGELEKGLYLMSWLVLDPPICVDPGMGGAASIQKDLYKEAFGISEADVTKDPKNWPYAGLRGKQVSKTNKSMCCEDYVQWIPINFQDLIDAKQGALFASGNQFDWAEWGGTGSNDFHEYLFALVKWNTDTKVTIKVGSDDPEQTWVNGEKVCEGLGDRNWARDTETAEFEVKAGEWVAIMSEVGERGGEIGFTMRIEPPPDDHTLDIEAATAVSPGNKLSTSWGAIKAMRLR